MAAAADPPVTVAVVGRADEARSQLAGALADLGARSVFEGEPGSLDLDALRAAGVRVVVVNLDDVVSEQLDHLQPLFDDDDVRVIFNEADVAGQLAGWDLARWARHLAAKVMGHGDTNPPPPPGAEPVPNFDLLPTPGAPLKPSEITTGTRFEDFELEAAAVAMGVPATPRFDEPEEQARATLGDIDRDELERQLERFQAGFGEPAPAGDVDEDSLSFEPAPEPGADIDVADTVDAAADGSLTSETAIVDTDVGANGDEFAARADFDAASWETQASGGSSATGDADAFEHAFDTGADGPSAAATSASAPADLPAPDLAWSEADEMPEPLRPTPIEAIAGDLEALHAHDPQADAQAPPGSREVDDYAPDEARLAADIGMLQLAESFDEVNHDTPADAGDDFARAFDADAGDDIGIDPAADDAATARAEPTPYDFGSLELAPLDADEAPVAVAAAASAANYDFGALDLSLEPLEEELSASASALPRVIVLGASIGGPDALRTYLAALPAGLPALLVLAQHLENGYFDRLAEQLQKSSKLPVKVPAAGHAARAGEVLVIGADERFDIALDGAVQRTPLAQPARYRPCIDDVLRMVADRFGPRATAIIFSGMAGDGVEGSVYLASKGGQVWAQSPESCVVSSMVDGATARGVVEFVGTPRELAERTVERYGSNGESAA